jgi:hypothetical protein
MTDVINTTTDATDRSYHVECDATITTLQNQRSLLEERLATNDANLARAYETTTRLQRRINYIAGELRDQAISRGWCSEYGDFVTRINNHEGEDVLEHMERDVRFEITASAVLSVQDADDGVDSLNDLLENVLRDHGYTDLSIRIISNQ